MINKIKLIDKLLTKWINTMLGCDTYDLQKGWKMSNYIPKVGEKCLAVRDGEWVKVNLLYKGNNGQINVYACIELNDHSDSGLLFWSSALKPIPTEEDKMVDEALELFSALDAPCLYTIKTLIKAGWHNQPKVEPISQFDFCEVMYEKATHRIAYKYLAENKHIIVKD